VVPVLFFSRANVPHHMASTTIAHTAPSSDKSDLCLPGACIRDKATCSQFGRELASPDCAATPSPTSKLSKSPLERGTFDIALNTASGHEEVAVKNRRTACAGCSIASP
jgi:hypothetical protein